MGKEVQADPRGVCVARIRWSTRPFTARSTSARQLTGRTHLEGESCNPDQASCATRTWLTLIRYLPSLYPHAAPDRSILSPAE
jgi:hypothetical protein